MDPHQAHPSQEGNTKKSPLENLSREELIKKCKGLLGLAQKAKQAKDEFAEENKRIKEELNKFATQKIIDKESLTAMKEMVDALTESKLSQTSQIADLQVQISKYANQATMLTRINNESTEITIENESLKRQVQRLSDENDDLLANLDSMQKKLDQMNQFGMQQQKDLILLEEATVKWNILEKTLKEKLDVSEKEISKLKGDIVELEIKLRIKEGEDQRYNQKCLEVDNCSLENYAALQEKSKHYQELCAKQAEELDQLRKTGEFQNVKVQNFKLKFIEVTMKLKKLKKSKQVLMNAVQEYYVSIPKWQRDVQAASKQLFVHLNCLDSAKKGLEHKVAFLEAQLLTVGANKTFYEKRLESLMECCNKLFTEEVEISNQQHLNYKKNISFKDISTTTEIATETPNATIQKLEELLEIATSNYEVSCKHLSTMQEDFNKQSIQLETTTSELQSIQQFLDSERKNREELELECDKIGAHISILREENTNLRKELEGSKNQVERLESTLSVTEERHTDLLGEMRELNEALKCRGDVISRQQDKIVELEKEMKISRDNLSEAEVNLSQKENFIVKKESEINKINKEMTETKDEISRLLHQARENEKIIQNLSEEVTSMRDHTYDAQSEVLSTSTVSKAEESARLKEFDDSFEEKYNKLRGLAIKLKKKVQEQANQIMILERDNKKNSEEKNEIKIKLGSINVQVKNLQTLQNENDNLLDEIEKVKKEKDNVEKQVKMLNEKIQNFAASRTNSKDTTDNAIQEYQNQIRILKQEKDSFNLIRKEWEKERELLKHEITTKEKELNTLRQQNEKTKVELEKFRAVGKQSSVLNLEIEAYEKSLNDATQNIKTKDSLIKDLQENIKSKNDFLDSNKKEIKLLEESLQAERTHSEELKQQIDIQQAKLKESEHTKSKLREYLQNLTSKSENLKSQVDQLRLELSELAREKDNLITTFQKEKEDLYRQAVNMKESLTTFTADLKRTEYELEDVRTEYANYKVRAQSVLRQNQTKETSRERELEEEVTVMRSTIENLNLEVNSLKETFTASEKKVEEFRQDNERIQKRCKELIQLLEESRLQNDAALEENKKQSLDYQESLKSHRLQIDAINACYKQQVEELVKKHAIEIEELKKTGISSKENKLVSRLAPFGSSRTTDEQKIDLILMEREDAEGSETSVPAPKRKISFMRSKHDLIPLDELLNSSFEENTREEIRCESPSAELQIAKERLQAQESRVRHLTSLLSETEQDLAKVAQLNEVLKEEVRRHERAIEREQHIQNSEYLKNIVLKFLTLNSGDERSRLVPVLNTILKLSPEETHALQNVAKGTDVIQRSWGSYLPIWSNHQ